MFEHLDDPAPPTFGTSELEGVVRRRQARRRRAGLMGLAAAGVPALVVGGLVVALAADDSGYVVTSQPDGVTESVSAPTAAPTTASGTTVASSPTTSSSTSTTTAPTATTTTAPDPTGTSEDVTLLADRDTALHADEWLLPTDPPAGYVESGGSVEVRSGRRPDGVVGSGPADRVEVRTYSLSLSDPSGPTDRIEITIQDEPLSMVTINGVTPVDDQIDGVSWLVGSGPLSPDDRGTQHVARRNVGDTSVTVTAQGELDEATFRRMVASLAIVPRSVLDSPITDPEGPEARVIFSEEAFGDPVSYRVQTFADDVSGAPFDGEWQCAYLVRDSARSSACGVPSDDLITGTELHTTHQPAGEARLEVIAYGVTGPVVTHVEVAMFNGDVVVADTKPTIDGGDRRYWFFADSFEFDPELLVADQPLFLPPTVGSITAFDADGNVVAVARPRTADESS